MGRGFESLLDHQNAVWYMHIEPLGRLLIRVSTVRARDGVPESRKALHVNALRPVAEAGQDTMIFKPILANHGVCFFRILCYDSMIWGNPDETILRQDGQRGGPAIREH